MTGGALSGICPPGFFCMDATTMLCIVLVALAVLAIVVYVLRETGYLGSQSKPQPQPQVIVVKTPAAPAAPTITLNADPRFAPMPPEQSYNTPADTGMPIPAGLGALPVNSYTRGVPGAYQQVGLLTTPGGTETSGSPTRTILPLFGRSIDSNRNRWNYYTRSDGINPVQVPLQYKRRNCDDDNGCDEVSDGDSVGVPILGNSFTVSLYKYSTPRYLPAM